MKPVERLVWVDLETTGLDPEKDLILEVALVITDRELNELVADSWVVRPPNGLPAMHPVVVDMHGKNGLLGELHDGDTVAIVDVHAAALVHEFSVSGGPVAGSSVHFDRRFIERSMPLLAACFSHRCYDVSTLKQAWCLANGEEWKDDAPPAHRALDDIRGSIAIAKSVLVSRT